MAEQYGISEEELALIKTQSARRAANRREFLKQSMNPYKGEAGYVFDPAVQRFMSMKATQFDHFKPYKSSTLMSIGLVLVPMAAYGYMIWLERSTREKKIRSGQLRYRERMFKLQ